MRYKIHEDNVERLEKKLTTIRNKCEKYGCAYNFKKEEEVFVKDEDGNIVKYVMFEVDGIAKQNGWTFVATVEFTENGNIIRKAGNVDVEVPERYYTSAPICEHCGTRRRRKNTYIIMNEDGEFKQVGRSCLKDFTRGLDAELVASYIQMFDSLIEGESVDASCRGTHRYIEIKELLRYAFEVVKKFGYANAYSEYPTKARVSNYYYVNTGFLNDSKGLIRKEMEEVGFDAYTEENECTVTKALEWLSAQEENTNYIHNLKTVCSLPYITDKEIGIASSLAVAYQKVVEKEERKTIEATNSKSEYVGNIGDRITIAIVERKVVTSWNTQYGVTMIWKIVDADGNVYTWKTSNYIDEEATQLIGTIKAHTEFRGVKQTELTRCKIK